MTASFRFSKTCQFWPFLAFLKNFCKCERSSLRSQCWMRLFLWFSNTVVSLSGFLVGTKVSERFCNSKAHVHISRQYGNTTWQLVILTTHLFQFHWEEVWMKWSETKIGFSQLLSTKLTVFSFNWLIFLVFIDLILIIDFGKILETILKIEFCKKIQFCQNFIYFIWIFVPKFEDILQYFHP